MSLVKRGSYDHPFLSEVRRYRVAPVGSSPGRLRQSGGCATGADCPAGVNGNAFDDSELTYIRA
jgi:hypothetical protein